MDSVLIVVAGAVAFSFLMKAVFASYFKAKEDYVDRITAKMRGLENAED